LVLVGPGIPAGVRQELPVSNAWTFDAVLDFVGAPAGESSNARSLLGGVREDATWGPGPVFIDNLNQVAVADARVFARQDREPASFGGLWSAPNPNTGGF
jgi:hypothetical protein